MRKVKLAVKFILLTSSLILLTSLGLSIFLIQQNAQSIKQGIENRGQALAKNLAANSEYGVLIGSEEMLSALEQSVLQAEDVLYAIIQDAQGNILAKTNISEEMVEKITQQGIKAGKIVVQSSSRGKSAQRIYDFASSIKTKKSRQNRTRDEIVFFSAIDSLSEGQESDSTSTEYEEIGLARVGMSLARMDARINRAAKTAVLITIWVITLGISATVVLVSLIVKPIRELVSATEKISQGELDSVVEVKSQDEIGGLAVTFNKMTHDLKQYRDGLVSAKEAAEAASQAKSELLAKLQKSNQELKEATAQLVQSEKLSALGELTAGVAHELNQPLNGIKIICQSISMDIQRDRFEEEELEEDLNDVVYLVDRMAEIIDHMRVYTRRTEGMPKEMIDVNSVIEGAFKFLGQQLKNHNIEVVKKLSDDLPPIIGDAIRLEQVVMNLVTNARNAVESSQKERKSIRITTYQNDGKPPAIDNHAVVVEVTDNGVGMPEDVRQKIFQPFFTTKEPGKGTGLGLSVSSKIIEEHNGRIEVESQVGEGTTFRVMLPPANEE